ncbi:PorT family protein [Ancylomarina sp. DW003]|nr:porin family protein [Ancylomarina sp. DW003]MDE5424362.1 PorT family protein [Ancylomarina sp. DW003]
MKKILVVVCLLIASYSYAQDVKFGLKAGLNLANTAGSDVEDNKINTRFYFGGFVNAPITEIVSFQPELVISMQGVKADENISGMSAEINTSYLNIPLLFKVRLDPANTVHFYAGPQLGFVLKGEQEVEMGSTTNTEDIKEYMNKVDFGLNFGLSFNVSEEFALDLRYNRGFTKILEDGGKAFNSVIQLGAAYTF